LVQEELDAPCCWGAGVGYHRSNRTIGLGVLLYMLGLSYRHTEEVLSALGCRSGKSSVERTWEQVSDAPVDPTNNATERLIGLTFKIRAKTMRGFKSMAKVLAHPHLSFFLRGQDGVCDLRKVI